MKVRQHQTTFTTFMGSISATELLAFVRQTLEIPDNAVVRLWANDGSEDTDVSDEDPLRFTISLRAESAPSAGESTIPMRAVVNVTPAAPEEPAAPLG